MSALFIRAIKALPEEYISDDTYFAANYDFISAGHYTLPAIDYTDERGWKLIGPYTDEVYTDEIY